MVVSEVVMEEEEGEKKPSLDLPKPDLNQMLPFRPRAQPRM